MALSESGTYKIRPAGRLVLTIGRDLIQDVHAAVVELVKNAYDADSPNVDIRFDGACDQKSYSVTISDNGHGMTAEDVISKWMVPSTTDKLNRRTSPAGRVMQGRKGVGRYATSVLGETLLLETVTEDGNETKALIEWDRFEQAEFLDDVEITIQTTSTNSRSGTRLTIEGNQSHLNWWTKERLNQLRTELRKLQTPLPDAFDDDPFQITLTVKRMPDTDDSQQELIEPFPLHAIFDYRITGTINSDGTGMFEYSNQKFDSSPVETIPFNLTTPTKCGALTYDIRAYDRDTDSINALIGRGLTDNSGRYLGNLEARRLLNDFNGIGVYRNGFRIRPLGDQGHDWLKLNQRRVQNPSMRISSNQVIGLVQIEAEESSGLIEKSARDGLKEDAAYFALEEITKKVISLIEIRRYRHRRMMEEASNKGRTSRDIATLLSTDNIKDRIRTQLTRIGVSEETNRRIADIIDTDQQIKNAAVIRLRDDITRYEGQVTLGKIIEVILHEGRRPLSFFRNEFPYLRNYSEAFLVRRDEGNLNDILFVADGMANSAEEFVNLFAKLDPLASRRRGPKQTFKINSVLLSTFDLFSTAFRINCVNYNIDCSENCVFYGWSEDFNRIFVNLIENSLYWFAEGWEGEKNINVTVNTDGNQVRWIDYRDSGPGIDPALIQNDLIFEPGFSTRPSGTGLGLAIAGDAASRNDVDLTAIAVQEGVFFRLEPTGVIDDGD